MAEALEIVSSQDPQEQQAAGDGENQPKHASVDQFSYDDFESSRVFAYLYKIEDPFRQGMAERRLSVRAQEVGFKDFRRLFALYKQSQKNKELPTINQDGITNFAGQNAEYSIGEWTADEMGVYRPSGNQMVVACSHPIYPAVRMRSIDTSTIKYELRFKRGGNTARASWTPVLIEASDMASPNDLVKRLSPFGVSVSCGDRAKALVDYLRDFVDLNYDVIPEVRCVSRMGWNEEGFAPYNGGIVYDGADTFRGIYEAIKECGDYQKWLDEAKAMRSYSLTGKIVLAASFAAPLIEPLGISSFFVHLWSSSSGTAKTVAQMVAAAAWAEPTAGGPFFPTMRSTSTGFELLAGFLHSLPMFMDELQLAKDHHGKVQFNVYELASGAGKLRANKGLGLNYTPRWNTVFITGGETPIVSETDGEGALNRVLEIECFADQKIVEDGHKTANVVRENYGFAGKKFVEKLQEPGSIDRAKQLYDKFFTECCRKDTTEKQAMAAAALLTADTLATEWIFCDGSALSVKDIAEYLKEKQTISIMQRGYDILCDWVSINANKLRGIVDGDKYECYGILDDNYACIIKSVFDRICSENAINARGLLSHLKSRGLISVGSKGYTKMTYLGKNENGSYNRAHCICLKLPSETEDCANDCTTSNFVQISDEDTELPF